MTRIFRARDIRESKTFAQQRNKIEPNIRRFDQQFHAVSWALARRPEAFTRITDTRLWCMKTAGFPNAPPLLIWYGFDANVVYLRGIEEAEVEKESE